MFREHACVFVALAALAAMSIGCSKDEPAAPAAPEALAVPAPPPSLPEIAFEILKTNDAPRLPEITMTAADFTALAELEMRRSPQKPAPEVVEERSAQAAKTALSQATRRMKRVRDHAEKIGFDWDGATLVSAATRTGPYDPNAKDLHIDIFLIIESGGKQLKVKMDDCFNVNGRYRLADGFSVGR